MLRESIDHVPGDDLADGTAGTSVITSGNCCLIGATHCKFVYSYSLCDPEQRCCVLQAVVAAASTLVWILARIMPRPLRLVCPKPRDHVLPLCSSNLVWRIAHFANVPI